MIRADKNILFTRWIHSAGFDCMLPHHQDHHNHHCIPFCDDDVLVINDYEMVPYSCSIDVADDDARSVSFVTGKWKLSAQGGKCFALLSPKFYHITQHTQCISTHGEQNHSKLFWRTWLSHQIVVKIQLSLLSLSVGFSVFDVWWWNLISQPDLR